MILRLAFKLYSASPRRRLRPVMACLWPGYGRAWSLFQGHIWLDYERLCGLFYGITHAKMGVEGEGCYYLPL